ncbi:MAG: major facilitator superfamily 1 [Fluviicola sp.]|jgi:DHA1 family tetracycline resistance protein-like MFS transporter|uniref:TCR/Tet family MFS transporter n=1 Tax=Fluviicola sp. TaxID=1917219 RepID=UPI002616DCD6|nr:TCR/Tet family MFS transporter [Fluviicola sp.]MDF3029097.1 major facilitator superfamily 1 [Fluviicola sp.]
MSEKQTQGLIFILITICIDSIGLGIIIPSLPSLIADATHLSITESSKYSIPVLITYAAMQFLFSPLIGNLSDRYGRRPIILMSLLGLGLDYVFMFFAPSLAWLIVGRAVSGMFGASFTTAAAYIADISTDDNRARNFGLIGAAFGIGFIIGPAIGGVASEFGLRVPFMVAAFLSLANFIYGLIFLKESLPPGDRRKFEIKRANPIGAIKQIVHFPKYRGLFVVTFIVLLSNMAVHSVWNYYTIARFGWEIRDVGISLAVVGVCFGVVQGAMAGWIVKKMGEKGAATLGLVILSLVTLGIGLVPYGWMMYVIILPYAFSGIVDPSIRSLVSGEVKSNEQGELQGIFTSLMSLAEIVGPMFMIWIFYKSVPLAEKNSIFYGTPFFVAGALALIALILLRYVFSKIAFKANEALLDEKMEESMES